MALAMAAIVLMAHAGVVYHAHIALVTGVVADIPTAFLESVYIIRAKEVCVIMETALVRATFKHAKGVCVSMAGVLVDNAITITTITKPKVVLEVYVPLKDAYVQGSVNTDGVQEVCVNTAHVKIIIANINRNKFFKIAFLLI